jgi:SOS-response transcriptional repressor LexA
MTSQQKKVYDFIIAFQKLRGITPSYSEIATGLGLRSKSNIWRLVHELKGKGLIKLQPHMARSIKPVDNTVKEMAKL